MIQFCIDNKHFMGVYHDYQNQGCLIRGVFNRAIENRHVFNRAVLNRGVFNRAFNFLSIPPTMKLFDGTMAANSKMWPQILENP